MSWARRLRGAFILPAFSPSYGLQSSGGSALTKGGFHRVTIVADPDPPANQQSWSYNSASGPSLPPMIQPIVGTGDAKTAKEAEKLAALHACMQLSAKGLFTSVRPAFSLASSIPLTTDLDFRRATSLSARKAVSLPQQQNPPPKPPPRTPRPPSSTVLPTRRPTIRLVLPLWPSTRPRRPLRLTTARRSRFRMETGSRLRRRGRSWISIVRRRDFYQ